MKLPNLPGNLDNIYEKAISELGLEAELSNYEEGKLNPNVTLKGTLTPYLQHDFLKFFQNELKHSMIGRTYFFQLPKFLFEGEELESKNFIEERRFRISLIDSNISYEKKQKLQKGNEIGVSLSNNEIYGFEELQSLNNNKYILIMKEINELILRGKARSVRNLSFLDCISKDLLALKNS